LKFCHLFNANVFCNNYLPVLLVSELIKAFTTPPENLPQADQQQKA